MLGTLRNTQSVKLKVYSAYSSMCPYQYQRQNQTPLTHHFICWPIDLSFAARRLYTLDMLLNSQRLCMRGYTGSPPSCIYAKCIWKWDVACPILMKQEKQALYSMLELFKCKSYLRYTKCSQAILVKLPTSIGGLVQWLSFLGFLIYKLHS